LAHAGFFEQGGEGVDAQLAALLERPGLLGPALRVLQGGEHSEDGVGESKVANSALWANASGHLGAAAGRVVGDAGGAGQGGHLFVPALLHLVDEIAEAQGMEVVVAHLGAEGGDVGVPRRLLVGGEAAGLGGQSAGMHW
jgi:hypothetical protein